MATERTAARFDLRLSSTELACFREAARVKNVSIAELVRSSVAEEAKRLGLAVPAV